MRIRVWNKAVVAKIKEREKAAQEFAEAKAAGKNAALLEQQRPNVFSMSIANIMPGQRVEVQLTYSEMLTPDQGIYEFVYPTVVGPRYSNTPEASAPEDSKWVKSPYLHQGDLSPAPFSIRVNLSTGVPLSDLRSPSHQPRIDWQGAALAHVSLDHDASNRDFILDYRLSGREIQSGLMVFESAQGTSFFTVQPPGASLPATFRRASTFSCSTSRFDARLPARHGKAGHGKPHRSLKPTDTFNVVLFSGASRLLSPVSCRQFAKRGARVSVIAAERGGGGTELEAALRTAIQLPRSASYPAPSSLSPMATSLRKQAPSS
jgi:Ca-activated chloride channel family protein